MIYWTLSSKVARAALRSHKEEPRAIIGGRSMFTHVRLQHCSTRNVKGDVKDSTPTDQLLPPDLEPISRCVIIGRAKAH